MPSIEEQYTDEMYEQRGYFATWEPNVPIELGDRGPIDGRRFKPQGDLSQWGIEFDVTDEGQPADIDYSSKSEQIAEMLEPTSPRTLRQQVAP